MCCNRVAIKAKWDACVCCSKLWASQASIRRNKKLTVFSCKQQHSESRKVQISRDDVRKQQSRGGEVELKRATNKTRPWNQKINRSKVERSKRGQVVEGGWKEPLFISDACRWWGHEKKLSKKKSQDKSTNTWRLHTDKDSIVWTLPDFRDLISS